MGCAARAVGNATPYIARLLDARKSICKPSAGRLSTYETFVEG